VTNERLTVSPLPDLPGGREEWGDLALAAGNPFSTWEWASAWWRHLGDGREQRILGCRRADGSLAGVLPLYLAARRPLRTLRFVGHDPADQLGPVCRPEDRDAVAAAFRDALSASRDWDVCIAERLSEDDGWPELLDGVRTRRERSPVLQLPGGSWDDFLAGKSSNFRQQARRGERKLVREHGLTFRLTSDPDRLDEDMETLFRLHEGRWAEAGTSALPDFLKPFHRDFARLALESGWLRLWIAELDGAPAAAWYGFRLGDADWFYQSGRDLAWERSRIGFVLLLHTVRDAIEHGRSEYRLLLGSESYKDRLAEHEDHATTVAIARGAAGRTALAAARLRGRVRGNGAGAAIPALAEAPAPPV
jgi:CelD/BcsL family acetyltransferase involved in cellulose biosynthesis